MPTYDFECGKCGKTAEVFLHFDESPPKKCKCGGKLKKVFHPVGIVFKGSGFYCTDNKGGGNGGKKETVKEKKDKKEKPEKKDTTSKESSKDSSKSSETAKEPAKA